MGWEEQNKLSLCILETNPAFLYLKCIAINSTKIKHKFKILQRVSLPQNQPHACPHPLAYPNRIADRSIPGGSSRNLKMMISTIPWGRVDRDQAFCAVRPNAVSNALKFSSSANAPSTPKRLTLSTILERAASHNWISSTQPYRLGSRNCQIKRSVSGPRVKRYGYRARKRMVPPAVSDTIKTKEHRYTYYSRQDAPRHLRQLMFWALTSYETAWSGHA
jgi:hypothetical protein